MIECEAIVKRYEEPARWYIGAVSEFFYKLPKQDTSPTSETTYTMKLDTYIGSLFPALEEIIPVDCWGAVMWEFIDKSKHPHSVPQCFWERLTGMVPTKEDCTTESWKIAEEYVWDNGLYDKNIRFIIWDTRTTGSDMPGQHIPRDDIFSGISYVDKSLNGDRELTESWQKWLRQQESRGKNTRKTHKRQAVSDQKIKKREGGKGKGSMRDKHVDLQECLNTLQELYM